MADIKYFDVIQKPIVTEKSMNACLLYTSDAADE